MESRLSSALTNLTLKIDYLSILILAKYYIAEGFSLQASPQVGFLLADNLETEFDGETETDDFKDYVTSLDFWLGLGLATKWKLVYLVMLVTFLV